MISLFRRQTPEAAPTPTRHVLPTEEAHRLANGLGSVVMSLGCLTGNLAALAQTINARLADGALEREEALRLMAELRVIHEQGERACSEVSRVRGSLEQHDKHA